MTPVDAERALARLNMQLEHLYAEADRITRTVAPGSAQSMLISIHQEQAETLAQKGHMLTMQERWQEALQAFDASLALKPDAEIDVARQAIKNRLFI